MTTQLKPDRVGRRRVHLGKRAVVLVGALLLVIVSFTFEFFAERRAHRLNNALVSAVKAEDANRVKALLRLGADPNCRVTQSGRAVGAVGKWENVIAVLFHRHNSSLTGRPIIMLAIVDEPFANVDSQSRRAAGAEIVEELLRCDADVSARDSEGDTALITSLSFGRAVSLAAVSSLLEHGADPNTVSGSGEPAIILAINDGPRGSALLLLAHGANANAYDRAGRTATMRAILRGDAPTVQSLISHGASLSATDYYGRSALDYAYAVQSTSGPFAGLYYVTRRRIPQIVAMLHKAGETH